MNWRAVLDPASLLRMRGLPADAWDVLIRTLRGSATTLMTRCSARLRLRFPGKRVADLGDFGFIEFIIDEDAALIRVVGLVWTG